MAQLRPPLQNQRDARITSFSADYGSMDGNYRERCLAAKGKKCHICGNEQNIVAHHIDGDRANDQVENLLPVCDSCHKSIHWGADGYEEWFEKLHPGSQWPDADPDQKTSITMNAVIGERLRDMKPPGASWDSFFLQLLEDLQTPTAVELSESSVNAIAGQLMESGVSISQNDIEAIADLASDQTVDSLRTLQR